MADEPTPSDAPEETPEDTPADPTPPAGDLGDPGKKALEAERAARRRAEKDAKAAKAEADKLREQTQSETEKLLAAAKAEGRAEVLTVANRRLVSAEVRAAAASKLHDPADAIAHLNLDDFEVSEDGEVDQQAITAAIADLVEAKPYLAAGATPKPTGSPDGGAREPNQPQSLDDRIAEAQQAGDVRTVLALNAQKLVQLPGA